MTNWQPLPGLMQQIATEMIHELIDRLHKAGYTDIRPSHSRVFENLESDSDGIRLTELASRARMTQPSMSELVIGLERLGYVARNVDPADGRARLVELTPRGRQFQDTAFEILGQLEREWFGGESNLEVVRGILEEARSRQSQPRLKETHTS